MIPLGVNGAAVTAQGSGFVLVRLRRAPATPPSSRRGELTAMVQDELPNRGCQGLAKFRRGGKVRPRAHLSELSALKPFGEPRSQSCRVAPVGSRNDQRGHIDRDEFLDRSEERRVGKECRCRWSPYH